MEENIIDIYENRLENMKLYSQSSFVLNVIKYAKEELMSAKDLPETQEILNFLKEYENIRAKYQNLYKK